MHSLCPVFKYFSSIFYNFWIEHYWLNRPTVFLLSNIWGFCSELLRIYQAYSSLCFWKTNEPKVYVTDRVSENFKLIVNCSFNRLSKFQWIFKMGSLSWVFVMHGILYICFQLQSVNEWMNEKPTFQILSFQNQWREKW